MGRDMAIPPLCPISVYGSKKILKVWHARSDMSVGFSVEEPSLAVFS